MKSLGDIIKLCLINLYLFVTLTANLFVFLNN